MKEKEKKNMKLSEFMSKYGDCEVTEEMEKCIKKPKGKPKGKSKGKWRPKIGEEYYYINGFGNGFYSVNSGCIGDNFCLDFVRVFKTQEEAERYREIMKACKKASFEPDWEDCNEFKYCFYYNHMDHRIGISHRYVSNFGVQFYFESHDKARELINKFGEKDIAKYVLGVEVDEDEW